MFWSSRSELAATSQKRPRELVHMRWYTVFKVSRTQCASVQLKWIGPKGNSTQRTPKNNQKTGRAQQGTNLIRYKDSISKTFIYFQSLRQTWWTVNMFTFIESSSVPQSLDCSIFIAAFLQNNSDISNLRQIAGTGVSIQWCEKSPRITGKIWVTLSFVCLSSRTAVMLVSFSREFTWSPDPHITSGDV